MRGWWWGCWWGESPAVRHGDQVRLGQQLVEQGEARALQSRHQRLALALLPAVAVGCGCRLLQSAHTQHTHLYLLRTSCTCLLQSAHTQHTHLEHPVRTSRTCLLQSAHTQHTHLEHLVRTSCTCLLQSALTHNTHTHLRVSTQDITHVCSSVCTHTHKQCIYSGHHPCVFFNLHMHTHLEYLLRTSRMCLLLSPYTTHTHSDHPVRTPHRCSTSHDNTMWTLSSSVSTHTLRASSLDNNMHV